MRPRQSRSRLQQGAHDRGPTFLPESRARSLLGQDANTECAFNSGGGAHGNQLWGEGGYLPLQFYDGAGIHVNQLGSSQLQQHGCVARHGKLDVQLSRTKRMALRFFFHRDQTKSGEIFIETRADAGTCRLSNSLKLDSSLSCSRSRTSRTEQGFFERGRSSVYIPKIKALED